MEWPVSEESKPVVKKITRKTRVINSPNVTAVDMGKGKTVPTDKLWVSRTKIILSSKGGGVK